MGDVSKYAEMCINLLKDPSLLYVTIRSSTPTSVPKVVGIADLTKRLAHRDELFEDELHQYTSYQEEEISESGRRKKKVIKLDDSDESKKKNKQDSYKPPENLVIRMSKISMPELMPKSKGKTKANEVTSPPVNSLPSRTSRTSIGLFGRQRKDDRNNSPSVQLAPPKPARPVSAGPVFSSSPKTKLKKSPRQGESPPTHSRLPSSSSLPVQTLRNPPLFPSDRIAHDTAQRRQSWFPPPQGFHPALHHQQSIPLAPNPSNPSLTSSLGNAALQMWTNRTRR